VTAVEIAEQVRSRRISAEEITRSTIATIHEHDGRIGSYLRVDQEEALRAARAVDARVRSGERGLPLAGVPVGIKDLIVTRGLETTCASRILEGWVPPYDATAVQRLRAAGAVLTGKLNMDEFGMGSSNENSAYGTARNPWDPDRTPGGSSGGAAAAVATGMCAAALGTDTGGSIRQPASFCGVVGLKPTYGRVSRYGLVAFASSLDQIGPLSRTVEDAALFLEVIGGHDTRDATSVSHPVPAFRQRLGDGVRGLRIGVPREYFVGGGMDPEVEACVRAAIAELQEQGAEIHDVSLPHTEYAVATYYVICTAEASANLARYDGVRYGLRARGSKDLREMYLHTRAVGFGREVKRRIMLGTYVLSAGYYDAYYGRAQKVRTLIRRDFEQVFCACDLIATPTSPTAAFRLGERVEDPLQMYLADVFTVPVSLAGLPGISLPCGMTRGGLPVGLQLIAPPFGEETMLRAARAYEQATEWHRRHPPTGDRD